MSNNIEKQDDEDTNEWINWIEEAITKEYFKYYEYKDFSNIQEIGCGGFAKVFRANWKNSGQYFALKSFFNLNNINGKELVRELKIQREINFHDNIITFCGITEFELGNQNGQLKNYGLVMEYADSGTLKNYLKKNFSSLTWNDKYNMAYQLACAVSCLHNEGMVHCDLHSKNVLVHQKIIKLVDFGLSRRIDASPKQSKLFGIVPYIDPIRFDTKRSYTLSEKNDIYSIGVLLWEISSGQPPFHTGEYNFALAVDILQGLREIPVPDTPEDYVKVYTECWDGEPDKRPTINQVVERLKANIKTESHQVNLQLSEPNTGSGPLSVDSSLHKLHEELLKEIKDFCEKDVAEIESSTANDSKVDPFTKFLTEIGDILNEVIEITEAAEHNKRICEALKQRVNAANLAVHDCKRIQGWFNNKNHLSLQNLVNIVTQIKEFIAEISQTKPLLEYIQTKSIEKIFKGICEEFDRCVDVLTFTITFKSSDELQQLKADQEDLTKYLEEMEASTKNFNDVTEIEVNVNKMEVNTNEVKAYAKELTKEDISNKWIEWIEEAIDKEYLKYYEYKHFSNIKEIRSGVFAKVFCANWNNNLGQHLVLKSFYNLNNVTIKEIVHELKLHRDVQHHTNIINFCGITKEFESDGQGQLSNYMLVMEYIDGGTLRNYLEQYELVWDDKYNLAYQLADVVSFLHNEGIVHRDLHSGNILVHENIIKLTDFGLSKRIEEASENQSRLFGIIPYVDPIVFRNNDPLNEKSDIYSIGVLLWEISSGQPPFYTEEYSVYLAVEIIRGRREIPVPDTPKDYVKVYTECWDGNPDKRPTASQVLERLKTISTIEQKEKLKKVNIIRKESQADLSSVYSSVSDLRELSHLINTFDYTKSLDLNSFSINDLQMNSSSMKDLNTLVYEIAEYVIKITNEGVEATLRKKHIIDYFNAHSINSEEIYNRLSTNQNILNSIFLLGYFNFYGIGKPKNYEVAFKYFSDPLIKNHSLTTYYVGLCYLREHGTKKDEKLAFNYLKESDSIGESGGIGCAAAQIIIGDCYYMGRGIKKDLKMAVFWYEKSAYNGNLKAKYKLGLSYLNGKGINKNHKRAFELFEQSADGGYSGGISMLGYCYYVGIGTKINKQRAFELYQKSASLGNKMAQYQLAKMYEKGKGIIKDVDQAKVWYKASADQGHKKAQNRLKKLSKNKKGISKDFCKIH